MRQYNIGSPFERIVWGISRPEYSITNPGNKKSTGDGDGPFYKMGESLRHY